MGKKRKKARWALYFMEYAGLRMMKTVLEILPLKTLYLSAEVLGWIAFHVLRIRRAVTMDNLRNAFGADYDEAELREIAARTYVNIGKSFLEVLVIRRFAGRIFEVVDFPDMNVMKRAIEGGKGVIIVSCHFGNWEINAVAIEAQGVPFTIASRRQSNPLADRLISRIRASAGLRVMVLGAEIKHIVRALRDNEWIGLISDQDAGKNGVFVDFFGRKASTPRGPAHLALKYHAPILVTMAMRTGNGTYRCIFREVPIDGNDTVESVTQRYTHMMENVIRQHPDQYFWMHRRWKTSPPSRQNDG